jgi:phosphoenolpyruvate synthase/pyruvate phosphate dikinase
MIYQFNTAPIPTLAEVGGKGLSLIKMTQAELPVPPGFVCAVSFFELWLASLQTTSEWTAVQTAIQNHEDLAPSTTALKTTCAELVLTTDQEQQLSEALQALPKDSFFAVRSSSPEEDLEGASFAGGYKTTLGVTENTLWDAIRDSFASAFDERVFVYKQQHGFAVEQPSIAVIVQQQIAAESAGVGFSLNPINNDYDEAIIDANWGLGESVVAGRVSPDHFVMDKVAKTIVEKQLGGKEIAVYLTPQGGIEDRPNPNSAEFCLSEAQVVEITAVLSRIETLYQHPIDIEWAFAEEALYILQARPITVYNPLPPEMLTKPGEHRRLYWDWGLTEGLTTNTPMSPLTLDWFFRILKVFYEPMIGPAELRADAEPGRSLMFAAGGRMYIDLSQILTLVSTKRIANASNQSMQDMDALLSELWRNVDQERYRAEKKLDSLRWEALLLWIPRAIWHSRRFMARTLSAFWNPERSYRQHEQVIDKTARDLKENLYPDLSLSAIIDKHNELLIPAIGQVALPLMVPYLYYLTRLASLSSGESEHLKRLVDTIEMGFTNNVALDLGIKLYRMSQLLTPADFSDLDQLAERLEHHELPANFLDAWDVFVAKYGSRGPDELELANPGYGDDPKLALEQMSYMVDSDFDPEETLKRHVAERQEAHEELQQKVSGRRRRQLQRAFKIIDLLASTRDMPKYLLVLANGAFRRRALLEGKRFVDKGRLDVADDIFWFTVDEIERANANPAFDLRQARDAKLPFYRKLEQVIAFPHLIDSRGRIGQVEQPEGDPNVLTGLGISRGVATGRVKILHTPREKPIEKGDVLVAYTTDPGWTPLFVNAEAVLLEVGGMLRHGGVVAREYGKPCVAGIQGITTTLHDGQHVEVDGGTGFVRLLD